MMGIAKRVAAEFGVTVEDLRGASQEHRLIEPRGKAFYQCRHVLQRRYTEIGRFFGNRDKSGVRRVIHKYMAARSNGEGDRSAA